MTCFIHVFDLDFESGAMIPSIRYRTINNEQSIHNDDFYNTMQNASICFW